MRLRTSGDSVLNRSLNAVRNISNPALNAWHDFWFQPVDPLMIGLIRLLTGWMLLYNLLVWGLDLEAFFSDHGLQPLSSIQSLHDDDPVFSFWLWTGDQWLWPMHFACVAIAAMFFLGVASRVTSVLCFLITISYSQRVPIANFGFDQILGFLCLYLSLAPSGACFSVDAIIRRWWRRKQGRSVDVPPSSSARMASRLIQLHLCAIYLWAGFAKLKGPSWWTGEAMWRVIANQEYQTMDLTWMAHVPWLPYLIAHVTIAWEVFFIVLVWQPRWRPLMLLMGILMHLGIGAFLGMWTFGLIMAFAYLAFSDPGLWRSRLNRLGNRNHDQTSMAPAESESTSLSLSSLSPSPASTPEDTTASIEPSPDEATYQNEFLDLNFELPIKPAEVESANIEPNRQSDVPQESAPSVCVIAVNTSDRSTLRRYLRGHAWACVALPSIDDGLSAMSRRRFDAVVVHCSSLNTNDVISFCEDVSDLTDQPVLVLLRASQLSAIDHLCQIRGISWTVLPASLKEIRQRVESVAARSCCSTTRSNTESNHAESL